MRNRIIIDLYTHTGDLEAQEMIEALKGIGIDGARHVRNAPLTAMQIKARTDVYRAAVDGEGITLQPGETDALWMSILGSEVHVPEHGTAATDEWPRAKRDGCPHAGTEIICRCQG